jgi:hypothetical protein
MKLNRELPWNLLLCTLVLGLGLLAFAPEIRANVFATNIRINGGTTNIVASTGETFSVSYLLNEPASAGCHRPTTLGRWPNPQPVFATGNPRHTSGV